MASKKQKGFKVWNRERTVKKMVGRIVSFADFKKKGAEKLGMKLSDLEMVVLEADGTEVDEEYFDALDNQTTLILLKKSQRWIASWETPQAVDEADGSRHEEVECDGFSNNAVLSQEQLQSGGDMLSRSGGNPAFLQLCAALRKDKANILTFNVEQLQLIADEPLDSVISTLHFTDDEARRLQDMCQDRADDKITMKEHKELIDLFKQHKHEILKSDNAEGPSDTKKRKMVEQS